MPRRSRVRWVAAATGLWLASGCGHQGPARAVSTTSRPALTAPPSPATTRPPATVPPTTRWRATAPQASAEAAAAALVGAWRNGDRAAAASVAAPAAVSALFAVPYPGSELAIPRGCSAAFPPLVCTYGPPGGASPNDAIYELSVSRTSGGWYVSSVRVLS